MHRHVINYGTFKVFVIPVETVILCIKDVVLSKAMI